jgi:hypothetical protein
MKVIARLKRAAEMDANIAIALHPPEGARRKRLYRNFGVERFKGHHVTRIRPVPEQLWPYRVQEHEWEKPLTDNEAMFLHTLKRYQEDPRTPQHQSIRPPTQIAPQVETETIKPEIATLKSAPIHLKQRFREGAMRQASLNKYERNPDARQRCIDHYGCRCSVCGFDFQKVYGGIGSGFIHVHHLKPLSEIGEEYLVDPIADLRPVCANCHEMIHNGPRPLSIEELKAIVLLLR